MANESFVQVAPDSTGKKIRNRQVTESQPDGSSADVQQQVVILADGDGKLLSSSTDQLLVKLLDEQRYMNRLLEHRLGNVTGQEKMRRSSPVVVAADQTRLPTMPARRFRELKLPALAANATYTSPWFDSEESGANLIDVFTKSDVAGTANQIQYANDPLGGMVVTAAVQTTISAGSTASTGASIFGRYWRFIYINGASPQAYFTGYVVETASPYTVLNSVGVPLIDVLQNATDPLRVRESVSTLCVTGTAAVNTGVTVTLLAVAGQFHYVTAIEIVKFYSVVGVAAAAPVVVTTTNLPGSLAFTFDQAATPQGQESRFYYEFPSAMKSSVVNTNTTIVAPVQLQTIWRINVWYYAAA